LKRPRILPIKIIVLERNQHQIQTARAIDTLNNAHCFNSWQTSSSKLATKLKKNSHLSLLFEIQTFLASAQNNSQSECHKKMSTNQNAARKTTKLFHQSQCCAI
jgi:hypothetical protein